MLKVSNNNNNNTTTKTEPRVAVVWLVFDSMTTLGCPFPFGVFKESSNSCWGSQQQTTNTHVRTHTQPWYGIHKKYFWMMRESSFIFFLSFSELSGPIDRVRRAECCLCCAQHRPCPAPLSLSLSLSHLQSSKLTSLLTKGHTYIHTYIIYLFIYLIRPPSSAISLL